jgi:hypothetical protein
MQASEVIKVSINRPYGEVHAFLGDVTNFVKWAVNPDSNMQPIGGNDWLVDLPRGRLAIRFTPANDFGVFDYQTFPPDADGGPVTPVRLLPNEEGCDLLLFWYQRPGVSDEKFRSDAEWVASDLARLKTLLEETRA